MKSIILPKNYSDNKFVWLQEGILKIKCQILTRFYNFLSTPLELNGEHILGGKICSWNTVLQRPSLPQICVNSSKLHAVVGHTEAVNPNPIKKLFYIICKCMCLRCGRSISFQQRQLSNEIFRRRKLFTIWHVKKVLSENWTYGMADRMWAPYQWNMEVYF